MSISTSRAQPGHFALGDYRYPRRLKREEFYPIAYRTMYYSRTMEAGLLDLFRKGYVKGTVTSSAGNESTAVGMALPLRPGRDVVSFLHRDFASHLLFGARPYDLVCQYMANRESITHAREGNVHHGDAAGRRFPMISHLGKMLSTVVGGTWAARQNGEDVFGLTVIGDGGSSTGEFHEAMNLASVLNVPVIFLVQNNGYSFSTPVSDQYKCRQLSDRAKGYGAEGHTIDGTDAWTVYSHVCDALDAMRATPGPVLLECMTIRIDGHAAYDKGEYVSREERDENRLRDPLKQTRQALQQACVLGESEIAAVEREVDEEIQFTIEAALKVARPHVPNQIACPLAESKPKTVEPFKAEKVKNGTAVNHALDYILSREPRSFLAGLDVATYGSAFKTCKGLVQRYGRDRVIDLPICESATIGLALGATQVGARPIVEFQFADFSTEVGSQLGLNAATWFFRSGSEVPMLVRLPCGGGLTMGAFHSGEFEGVWARFPGLKLIYPATAGETFEALVAGFYDPNPCLVFEHKLLYWSKSGDIDFDGNLDAIWKPRRYTAGTDVTVVALGAMVHQALTAAMNWEGRIEVWNPFVLQPLDLSSIVSSVKKTGRLLVVQESCETRGLGDRIISQIVQQCLSSLKRPPVLLSAPDTPVPFAQELEECYLPNSDKITACIEQLLQES